MCATIAVVALTATLLLAVVTLPTVDAGWNGVTAPPGTSMHLGNLFSQNPEYQSVSDKYERRRPQSEFSGFFRWPTGELYFHSKAAADCDGAPTCKDIDPHGQSSTSKKFNGAYADAFRMNYFVLPKNLYYTDQKYFLNTGSIPNIRLGDVAAVVYDGKLEFALYADNGPNDSAGETSTKLLQRFGFNPFSSDGRVIRGITKNVAYLVFPNTASLYSDAYDHAEIHALGLRLLQAFTVPGSPPVQRPAGNVCRASAGRGGTAGVCLRQSICDADPTKTFEKNRCKKDPKGVYCCFNKDGTSSTGTTTTTTPPTTPTPPPTTNVQSSNPSGGGETVGEYITRKCGRVDTSGVMGVSRQLLLEINCERPGIFVDFTGTPGMDFSGGGVFPLGQAVLLRKLIAAQRARGTTMRFTSITRSFVQQFVLFEWRRRGNCGQTLPVAEPGTSKHNGGLAVDVADTGGWRQYMINAGLSPLSGDPPHYLTSGTNVLKLTVKAFQRLWNVNNPNDRLVEDGIYTATSQTRRRLLRTPALGFARASSCDGSGTVAPTPTPRTSPTPPTPTPDADPTTPGSSNCQLGNGDAGVCITKSQCDAAPRGRRERNKCLQPEFKKRHDVQCCVKPSTTAPTRGLCRDRPCTGQTQALPSQPAQCAAAVCQLDECCRTVAPEVKGTCQPNACTGDFKKREPQPAQCRGATCAEDECCVFAPEAGTCQGFGACAAHLKPRPDAPAECAGPRCRADECCIPLDVCAQQPCGRDKIPRHSDPSRVTCPAAGCTVDHCCVAPPTCNQHKCTRGVPRSGAAATAPCAALHCTDGECCHTRSCATFGCPRGQIALLSPRPSDIFCTRDDRTCTPEECCEPLPTCQSPPFQCGSGSFLRQATGNTCVGRQCQPGECCQPNPLCTQNGFQCRRPAVFVTNPGSVRCSGRTCEDSDCCEQPGQCSAAVCGANMVLSRTAVQHCLAKRCTPRECCEPRGLCFAFPLSRCGRHQHVGNSLAPCPAAECTASDCCRDNPTCATHQCSNSGIIRAIPESIPCAGATCDDNTCCDRPGSCQRHSCPNGLLIERPGRKLCRAKDCTDGECCEPFNTCASPRFTDCTVLRMHLLPDPHLVNCRARVCRADECCRDNPRCSTHRCPDKHFPTPGADDVPCVTKQCQDAECCTQNQRCGRWPCDVRGTHHPIRNMVAHVCDGRTCTEAECCRPNPTCRADHGACPAQYHNKDDFANIICSGPTCSVQHCCDRNQMCRDFRCSSAPKHHRRRSASALICAAAECTVGECCDPNPMCTSYAACHPRSTHLIDNASSVQCAGPTCRDAECCARNQMCIDFTCDANHHKLQRTLAGPPGPCPQAECRTSDCCAPNPTCRNFACQGLTHIRPNAGTIQCRMPECVPELCCEDNPTCSASFPCPSATHHLRRDYAQHTCGQYECTLRDCCDENPRCGSGSGSGSGSVSAGSMCPPNSVPKLEHAGIVCTSASCDVPTQCCEPRQVSVTVSGGQGERVQIPNGATYADPAAGLDFGAVVSSSDDGVDSATGADKLSERTYVVYNAGNDAVQLTGRLRVAVAATAASSSTSSLPCVDAWRVSTQPSTSQLLPRRRTSFSLSFAPRHNVTGPCPATVTLKFSGADTPAFTFVVTGAACAVGTDPATCQAATTASAAGVTLCRDPASSEWAPTPEGATASAACPVGQRGTRTRTCLSGGTFAAPIEACAPAPVCDDVAVRRCTRLFRQPCSVSAQTDALCNSCVDGYKANPAAVSVDDACVPVRDCPADTGLGYPDTRPGTYAVVPCRGSKPGKRIRACSVRGVWQGEGLYCQTGKPACRGDATWPTTLAGNVAVIDCVAPRAGVRHRQCSSNGRWEAAQTQCVIPDCGADDGWPQTKAGETTTRPCPSLLPLGTRRRTCAPHGAWADEDEGTCHAHGCARDGNWPTTPAGSDAALPCKAYPDRNQYRTCLVTGAWDRQVRNAAACQGPDCAPVAGGWPLTPAGELATIPCAKPGMQRGSQQRRCSARGVWGAVTNLCVDIVDGDAVVTDPTDGGKSGAKGGKDGTTGVTPGGGSGSSGDDDDGLGGGIIALIVLLLLAVVGVGAYFGHRAYRRRVHGGLKLRHLSYFADTDADNAASQSQYAAPSLAPSAVSAAASARSTADVGGGGGGGGGGLTSLKLSQRPPLVHANATRARGASTASDLSDTVVMNFEVSPSLAHTGSSKLKSQADDFNVFAPSRAATAVTGKATTTARPDLTSMSVRPGGAGGGSGGGGNRGGQSIALRADAAAGGINTHNHRNQKNSNADGGTRGLRRAAQRQTAAASRRTAASRGATTTQRQAQPQPATQADKSHLINRLGESVDFGAMQRSDFQSVENKQDKKMDR